MVFKNCKGFHFEKGGNNIFQDGFLILLIDYRYYYNVFLQPNIVRHTQNTKVQ
jgi:hypothetical protein